MKKFLTIVLAASLMLIGTNARAQVSVGGGFADLSFSGQDADPWNFTMPGFYFGANYDVPFSTLDGLAFEPGVYFLHYGKSFGSSTITERSYHANYIMVPLNIKYSIEAAPDLVFSAFTGPRFSFGFAGNAFDKSRLGFKNFDARWGFGVAMTYSEAIQLRFGYDLGLTKAIKDDTYGLKDGKIRRNVMHFGVAFLF